MFYVSTRILNDLRTKIVNLVRKSTSMFRKNGCFTFDKITVYIDVFLLDNIGDHRYICRCCLNWGKPLSKLHVKYIFFFKFNNI